MSWVLNTLINKLNTSNQKLGSGSGAGSRRLSDGVCLGALNSKLSWVSQEAAMMEAAACSVSGTPEAAPDR